MAFQPLIKHPFHRDATLAAGARAQGTTRIILTVLATAMLLIGSTVVRAQPHRRATHPTEEPITGREEATDGGTPLAALARFYRALNTRDLSLMGKNWSHGDDSVMDNPLGGITRGWPSIRAVYERIFQGQARFAFEFYDYTLHRAGDLFYAVGRERGRYAVGSSRVDLIIRTTRIFRKINGRWRQVHHHGSIDNPDMLRAYQALVD